MVVAQAVTVSLEDLKKGTISMDQLQAAFGPDSLGILVVQDVPAQYAALRRQLLSYASYLGNLPEDTLRALENAPARYLTGWSRGKETLRSGKVDMLKGSFYANCAFYVDPSLPCAVPTAEFSPATFPEYLSPNVWPEDVADNVLPGFRATFEELCRLIIDVSVLVARACDRYAERSIPGYAAGYLEGVVRTSTTTKARLLHYYPGEGKESETTAAAAAADDDDSDDWCATHLDHGCLTGLTSAMFVDEAVAAPDARAVQPTEEGLLPPLPELEASPDPAAGLYIQSRSGETVQVKIPRDCIAFQTGEALERITVGRFRAVPHYVRGTRAQTAGGRIARNTLAVFTQPNLGEDVDLEQHLTFGEFARGIVAKNTVA